ncbi:MAG: hypothetical protein PSX71_13770 [bacterium]|nr:hypothetical protein [bacterium]
MTTFWTILRRALLPATLLATSLTASATYVEGYQQPMQGWKILQPDYNKNSYLDAISFEWDYFMIHSSTWNGIVGYVLANPRGRAPYLGWALLPNGNNVGVVGEIPGQKPIANYVNFGIDNTSINATQRAMQAVAANGTYADYKALPAGGPSGEPAFQLKGKTADWEWNFLVTQDHANRDVQRQSTGAFTTAYGTDVGLLPEEEWNVDMTWPRTNVVGSVKLLATGQVINVNGKGYREDSWGKYLLSVDGWDFLVFGEDTANGVMGSWQTYHKSDKMDYLDMSFYDNGQLVSQRFFSYKNQMGWVHPNWKWDGEANSCVPTNTKIVAKNSQYTVEIDANIGSRQRPILSSQTVGVGIFFIQEQFPTVTGTIKRANGTVVSTFVTRAGGEFSRTRDAALWHSDLWCNLWSLDKHHRAMP